jgi:hypothetical protein
MSKLFFFIIVPPSRCCACGDYSTMREFMRNVAGQKGKIGVPGDGERIHFGRAFSRFEARSPR